ncbi:hypothetical protein GSI_07571 [Ganoderma sinense ZZ0214-1]|uniref:Methyltransferase n=1 Tax=Ganoderma sinense ZZ0214-1 TaxID=1077348 RepID=A0A2G8S9F0_9APHY|nr:hypothetical protein GSI_07571 [Ganoderma sinense ZZ0214-1]
MWQTLSPSTTHSLAHRCNGHYSYPHFPRDVPTTLNYFKALDDELPHRYVEPPEGKPTSNVGQDPHSALVHDNGFQYVHWPSVEKDLTEDEVIKGNYYPEVERILKEVTGTKRVFIFDLTIRRNPESDINRSDPKNRGPAESVHIDQAYWASVERVKYHLPEDAARLLQSRVRIINVWRPIVNLVAHKPLALADWRTLHADDLVPIDLAYPHRTGAIYGVNYNPARELAWARLTPHTVRRDNGNPKDAPYRQSIEVRALVVQLTPIVVFPVALTLQLYYVQRGT